MWTVDQGWGSPIPGEAGWESVTHTLLFLLPSLVSCLSGSSSVGCLQSTAFRHKFKRFSLEGSLKTSDFPFFFFFYKACTLQKKSLKAISVSGVKIERASDVLFWMSILAAFCSLCLNLYCVLFQSFDNLSGDPGGYISEKSDLAGKCFLSTHTHTVTHTSHSFYLALGITGFKMHSA